MIQLLAPYVDMA